MLYVLIALETAAAIYFLVILFRDGGESIANLCHQQTEKLLDDIPQPHDVNVNVDTQDACTNLVKGSKWAYIVSLVFSLLIQLCESLAESWCTSPDSPSDCAYIVSSYVSQLSDEQAFRAVERNWQGTAPPQSYYPHQPLEQNQSLLHPPTKYPYADPQHSFGANKEAV